jgi:hypothetical protein
VIPVIGISGTSDEISCSEQVSSAETIRSRMRQSGSRTLHFEYWSQFSASVEHAVTVSGPSIAWMMSATEMMAAARARR